MPLPTPSARDPREPEATSAAPEPTFSIQDVTGILLRRRGTILLVMVLMTLPALLFALTAGPRYTATASVMIEPRTVAGQTSPVASIVDTQRDIIRSRTLIQATMEDLDLYSVEAYRVDPDDPASLKGRLKALVKALQDWVGPKQPDFIGPPLPPDMLAEADEARRRDLAATAFAEDLSVGQSGESYVLRINFTAEDPALAANVATRIAELYVDRQASEKQEAAARAEKWLSDRVSRMREDVLEAERQLAEMRARNQFVFDKAAARSENAVLHQELERIADAKRASYEAMLSRYYDSRGRIESLAPDARMISRAQMPSDPSSMSPILLGAVSLTMAGMFGGGLALVREQLDRRVRDCRQIETGLGLQCLGLLPRLKGASMKDAAHLMAVSEPRSLYSQAARSLALRIIAVRAAPKVVLVSSALPGEGKSSCAAALATALTRTGKERVLLVDFDLGGPNVAKRFGLLPDAPGVASLLTEEGATEAASLIVRHEATGIDLLPAGRPDPRTPPLSRVTVDAILDDLRPRYDRIVIDAPCLLGIAEARLLALSVDAALLVTRWGRTNLDVAGAAADLLRDLGCPVLGTVLAQVDLRRHARHGQDHDLRHYRQVRRRYG